MSNDMVEHPLQVLLLLDDSYFALFLDWVKEDLELKEVLLFLIEADSKRFNNNSKNSFGINWPISRVYDCYLSPKSHFLKVIPKFMLDGISNLVKSKIPIPAVYSTICELAWNELLNRGGDIMASYLWPSIRRSLVGESLYLLSDLLGEKTKCLYLENFLKPKQSELYCLYCLKDVIHILNLLEQFKASESRQRKNLLHLKQLEQFDEKQYTLSSTASSTISPSGVSSSAAAGKAFTVGNSNLPPTANQRRMSGAGDATLIANLGNTPSSKYFSVMDALRFLLREVRALNTRYFSDKTQKRKVDSRRPSASGSSASASASAGGSNPLGGVSKGGGGGGSGSSVSSISTTPTNIFGHCSGPSDSSRFELATVVSSMTSVHIHDIDNLDPSFATATVHQLEKVLTVIERETFQYLLPYHQKFLKSDDYALLIAHERGCGCPAIQRYGKLQSLLTDRVQQKRIISWRDPEVNKKLFLCYQYVEPVESISPGSDHSSAHHSPVRTKLYLPPPLKLEGIGHATTLAGAPTAGSHSPNNPKSNSSAGSKGQGRELPELPRSDLKKSVPPSPDVSKINNNFGLRTPVESSNPSNLTRTPPKQSTNGKFPENNHSCKFAVISAEVALADLVLSVLDEGIQSELFAEDFLVTSPAMWSGDIAELIVNAIQRENNASGKLEVSPEEQNANLNRDIDIVLNSVNVEELWQTELRREEDELRQALQSGQCGDTSAFPARNWNKDFHVWIGRLLQQLFRETSLLDYVCADVGEDDEEDDDPRDIELVASFDSEHQQLSRQNSMTSATSVLNRDVNGVQTRKVLNERTQSSPRAGRRHRSKRSNSVSNSTDEGDKASIEIDGEKGDLEFNWIPTLTRSSTSDTLISEAFSPRDNTPQIRSRKRNKDDDLDFSDIRTIEEAEEEVDGVENEFGDATDTEYDVAGERYLKSKSTNNKSKDTVCLSLNSVQFEELLLLLDALYPAVDTTSYKSSRYNEDIRVTVSFTRLASTMNYSPIHSPGAMHHQMQSIKPFSREPSWSNSISINESESDQPQHSRQSSSLIFGGLRHRFQVGIAFARSPSDLYLPLRQAACRVAVESFRYESANGQSSCNKINPYKTPTKLSHHPPLQGSVPKDDNQPIDFSSSNDEFKNGGNSRDDESRDNCDANNKSISADNISTSNVNALGVNGAVVAGDLNVGNSGVSPAESIPVEPLACLNQDGMIKWDETPSKTGNLSKLAFLASLKKSKDKERQDLQNSSAQSLADLTEDPNKSRGGSFDEGTLPAAPSTATDATTTDSTTRTTSESHSSESQEQCAMNTLSTLSSQSPDSTPVSPVPIPTLNKINIDEANAKSSDMEEKETVTTPVVVSAPPSTAAERRARFQFLRVDTGPTDDTPVDKRIDLLRDQSAMALVPLSCKRSIGGRSGRLLSLTKDGNLILGLPAIYRSLPEQLNNPVHMRDLYPITNVKSRYQTNNLLPGPLDFSLINVIQSFGPEMFIQVYLLLLTNHSVVLISHSPTQLSMAQKAFSYLALPFRLNQTHQQKLLLNPKSFSQWVEIALGLQDPSQNAADFMRSHQMRREDSSVMNEAGMKSPKTSLNEIDCPMEVTNCPTSATDGVRGGGYLPTSHCRKSWLVGVHSEVWYGTRGVNGPAVLGDDFVMADIDLGMMLSPSHHQVSKQKASMDQYDSMNDPMSNDFHGASRQNAGGLSSAAGDGTQQMADHFLPPFQRGRLQYSLVFAKIRSERDFNGNIIRLATSTASPPPNATGAAPSSDKKPNKPVHSVNRLNGACRRLLKQLLKCLADERLYANGDDSIDENMMNDAKISNDKEGKNSIVKTDDVVFRMYSISGNMMRKFNKLVITSFAVFLSETLLGALPSTLDHFPNYHCVSCNFSQLAELLDLEPFLDCPVRPVVAMDPGSLEEEQDELLMPLSNLFAKRSNATNSNNDQLIDNFVAEDKTSDFFQSSLVPKTLFMTSSLEQLFCWELINSPLLVDLLGLHGEVLDAHSF